MNGIITQIVSLTCHGNAFLQGKKIEKYFPDNSACIFCNRISFVTLQKPLPGGNKEKENASSPDEWFLYIKSKGAKGIRLSRTPQNNPQISDRMSAGFVGCGGIWSMEVLLSNNLSEFWIPRWEVWNHKAPEQRIWRVTYICVCAEQTNNKKPFDLEEIRSQLTLALHEIHSFSSRLNCGGFTQCFADALDTLDSNNSILNGNHNDLAPDGFLTNKAQTILNACQKSWVFGGMGSWNDLGFDGDDQTEYERVSEQLFQIVNKAIEAVINSSFYGIE